MVGAVLIASHEGRGPLGEGVHSARCGGSRGTHNPWPVHSHLRGVDASCCSYDMPDPAAGTLLVPHIFGVGPYS